MYHMLFPAKYRRKIFSDEVEVSLRKVCQGIGLRHEIRFIEIGLDEDHVHFMVQGIPTMPVSRIVTIIKSLTAREIFKLHKEVKKELWGGALWTSSLSDFSPFDYKTVELCRILARKSLNMFNIRLISDKNRLYSLCFSLRSSKSDRLLVAIMSIQLGSTEAKRWFENM